MEFNPIIVLLSAVIFFVYGSICVISAMFTFFIESYHKLDEKLNINMLSSKILTPLDADIDILDVWMFEHNKVVGPLLILLCLVDMKLTFSLLNTLRP
jgi:hypothetical protein